MLTAVFPGLLEISARQCEVLHICNATFPSDEESSICLSQSGGRQKVHVGSFPTILPGGKQFLLHRCRLMHPWESLRLQGMFLPDVLLSAFSHNAIQQLAGNAFESGCCAAVLFVLQVVLSREGRLESPGKLEELCSDDAIATASSSVSSESSGAGDIEFDSDDSVWEVANGQAPSASWAMR